MTLIRKMPLFAVFWFALFALSTAGPTDFSDFSQEIAFLNILKQELIDAETLEKIPLERPSVNYTGYPISAAATTSTQTIVKRHNYPCETHTVQTPDGYILELHRIPNPGKPIIYLQHRLLSSSADWVVIGPENGPAFSLYDAGFDIWMGNTRGNTYSRKHATMKPSQGKFWDFSWHEIGYYDLPTIIDHILDLTGQKDLYYIGHSQGTTAFFVMASTRPEYNEKIRAAFALAPIAYLNEVKSLPVRLFSPLMDPLGGDVRNFGLLRWLTWRALADFNFSICTQVLYKFIGNHEYLPNAGFMRKLSSFLCKRQEVQPLCSNIMFLVMGFDSDQLNSTVLPEILEHVPAGASTKQMVHYGQLITKEPVFRQFDHGAQNFFRYGSLHPPSYNLSQITTEVHLIYGENDLLAVPSCVSKLHQALPNSVDYYRVPHDKFNHMDFLYAKDGLRLLYSRVVEKLRDAEKRRGLL